MPKSSHAHVSVALLAALCVAGFILPTSAQFETRGSSPFVPGYPPVSIALGDFNHDGKLDLAAVSFSTAQVAVLFGMGNGTFQAPAYYSVGFEPRSVAIADFNHDGNLDLAVTGFGTSTGIVSILLGNGDGTFQSAGDVTLDDYPIFVAVGDFNGDGIPDLVTSDPPYISVLLGNGDGTFQPPIDNQLFAPLTPDAIGLGGFNRDGKLDLAVAGQFGGSSEAKILLGNGDGTFQLGASYSIGGAPNSVTVADFRGIGTLDLAIGYYLGTGISVLLGNGDGTFQPKVDYPTPGTSSYLAAGDLNGDGKLDLAVAGSTADYATVLLGNGDGTFEPGVNYFVAVGGSGYIVIGDLNGDRKPDLAVVGTPSDVVVLLNTGVVSFSPTTPVQFPAQLVGGTSAAQTVTLTNTGTTTLTISSIAIKGQFNLSSSTTCAGSVAPGGNCAIDVTFQPLTQGLKSGLVSISDSASTKPQVIELMGAGTVVSLSPTQLTFPPQKVGTKSAAQLVTLTNTGSTALNISSIKITGQNRGDFSGFNNCGSSIGAGKSCTIKASFKPTKTGSRSAVVSITDTGGGSPQTVSLTGTGT